MTQFQTIRQAAKSTGLPEYFLRMRCKQNRLPGFYASSRFYVNVPLLLEQIDTESRAAGNAAGAQEATE